MFLMNFVREEHPDVSKIGDKIARVWNPNDIPTTFGNVMFCCILEGVGPHPNGYTYIYISYISYTLQ